MKKITVKIPAKVNLTLDVLGMKNGYHEISSLVASLNIYDVVTVSRRKEDAITLDFYGAPIYCETKKSNAYFAAEAFRKEFFTGGVAITVKRSIPVAAGLGGSSADMAGVLFGMKKLFGINRDVGFIAEKLGSDVNYMMQGGYAVISDRGEIVTPVESEQKMYAVILLGSKGVSAGESYKRYDKIGKVYGKSTAAAVGFLQNDDGDNFLKVLKNDLTCGSAEILPEINYSISVLKEFGTALMTGSGSAVYALFFKKGKRDKAYRKLKQVFKGRILKAETVAKRVK
ncbi:MAG: hypothetical protein IK147_01930 [Clostridia bacterium]|nr:hypothetical protein [Clostridia bacterium]